MLLCITKHLLMGNKLHICNTHLIHPSTKILALWLTCVATLQMQREVKERTLYEPQPLHIVCVCGNLRAEPVLKCVCVFTDCAINYV